MSEQEPRIVVGVDGSDSSKDALRWAIRQAKLTGGSVDAVIAWRYPSGYGWAPVPDGMVDLRDDARRALTAALAEVSGLEPEVPVRPLVAEGHAADVLLRAASGADLLVVGSRGHGGFTSALVGSVSLYCVLHAHCPVLVVREGKQALPALPHFIGAALPRQRCPHSVPCSPRRSEPVPGTSGSRSRYPRCSR